jgi:hypothetical protein
MNRPAEMSIGGIGRTSSIDGPLIRDPRHHVQKTGLHTKSDEKTHYRKLDNPNSWTPSPIYRSSKSICNHYNQEHREQPKHNIPMAPNLSYVANISNDNVQEKNLYSPPTQKPLCHIGLPSVTQVNIPLCQVDNFETEQSDETSTKLVNMKPVLRRSNRMTAKTNYEEAHSDKDKRGHFNDEIYARRMIGMNSSSKKEKRRL